MFLFWKALAGLFSFPKLDYTPTPRNARQEQYEKQWAACVAQLAREREAKEQE